MSPKSSIPQDAKSVTLDLTPNKPPKETTEMKSRFL
jgi:hypothetical protein